ncbi:MAG: hypothetical protein CL661_05300 [Bacteroidetes bacterium]|nr:hypothetical protein [Bacteroidota bacterium]
MKAIAYILLIITLLHCNSVLFSQNENNQDFNAASLMLSSPKKLTVGGYGQIDFNQPFGDNKIQNGKLDVHRLVILFGYRFNEKLSFVSEIEIEHVKEIYVEQAFLNYSVNTYLQIRGGLMLIPMGIINEYHEPTTFNGVERPLIDKYISPTTWREIGVGITGSVPELSLRYQTYLMNGFSSYNGSAQLSGKNGLRKGRQKGAESIIRTPVSASRIEYYGIMGLNLGLSVYLGGTQSTEFNKLNRDDNNAMTIADSSVVKIRMFGFDARYQRNGFQFRAQTYYTKLLNTSQYNYFTASDNVPNDVGNSMYGYYVEAGYNVFQELAKIKSELISFVRYSAFNTQNTVVSGLSTNPAYQMQVITAGIGWKPISEVAIKADIQLLKSDQESTFRNVFNAGIAIWF